MIILLSAMPQEITEILQHIPHKTYYWVGGVYHIGHIHEHEVLICAVGIGKTHAAMGASYFLSQYPSRIVLFSGIAGSIHADVHIDDIVMGIDSVQHDFDVSAFGHVRGHIPAIDGQISYRFIAGDEQLLAYARTYVPQSGAVHEGRIVSGDQFVNDRRNAYAYLHDELGGMAVEMEGASVAMVAAMYGVPHLIIRTISDEADGQASTDFPAFLKRASGNNYACITHILQQIPAFTK